MWMFVNATMKEATLAQAYAQAGISQPSEPSALTAAAATASSGVRGYCDMP